MISESLLAIDEECTHDVVPESVDNIGNYSNSSSRCGNSLKNLRVWNFWYMNDNINNIKHRNEIYHENS